MKDNSSMKMGKREIEKRDRQITYLNFKQGSNHDKLSAYRL